MMSWLCISAGGGRGERNRDCDYCFVLLYSSPGLFKMPCNLQIWMGLGIVNGPFAFLLFCSVFLFSIFFSREGGVLQHIINHISPKIRLSAYFRKRFMVYVQDSRTYWYECEVWSLLILIC